MFGESAHFANIMVEFENSHREMAVDVPDSFIGQTKTPPKYPPPPPSVMQQNGGSCSLHPAPRGHLRIEADGHLLNTIEPPTPPPGGHRSGKHQHHQLQQMPTEQQSLRMKQYHDEIMRKNLEVEKRHKTNEFLRHSIRNSQKMQALKENAKQQQQHGLANGGFEGHPPESPPPPPSLQSLMEAVKRIKLSGQGGTDVSSALGSIVANREFQRTYQLNQKVRYLTRVCMQQKQHACVSDIR